MAKQSAEPITWGSSKIIKIKSKHQEMTDNIIKQVPTILENPIIVMKSKNDESRLTLLGEAQNLMNTSEVLYVENNKKRVIEREKRTGLQLPVGSTINNSINSIPDSTENVNPSDEKIRNQQRIETPEASEVFIFYLL